MPVAPTGPVALDPYHGEDRRRIAGPVPSPFGRPYAAALAAVVVLAVVLVSVEIFSPASADKALRLLQLLQMASLLVAVAVGGLALGRWYLTGDTPALWIGVALLTYGIVRLAVVELTPLVLGTGMGWTQWLRPASQLVVIALLLRAATIVPVSAKVSGPRVALIAATGVVVTAVALRFVPVVATLLDGAGGPAPRSYEVSNLFGVMPVAYLALAVAFMLRARRRQRWLFAGLGLLLVTLAAGDFVRVLGPAPLEAALLGEEVLRLTGLLFALIGGTREILFTYRDTSVRLAQSEYTAMTAQERIRAGQAEAEERAHEARSALAAIEGATRTLEHYRDRLPPETQAALSTAVSGEIRRLQRLVSVEQPSDEISAFDVAACLAPVVASERARQARIQVDIASDLMVLGRSGATAQVAQTLFDNARIYAPGSALTVRGEVEPGWVTVRVEDRGPGVAPDERDVIFERGSRGANAGRHSGSGLGLYVAAELMRDQGGRLWVDDREGGGASFAFSLPAAELEAEEVADGLDDAPQIVEDRSLRPVDRGH